MHVFFSNFVYKHFFGSTTLAKQKKIKKDIRLIFSEILHSVETPHGGPCRLSCTFADKKSSSGCAPVIRTRVLLLPGPGHKERAREIRLKLEAKCPLASHSNLSEVTEVIAQTF